MALPDGYVIEVVAEDLDFPTGVAFDANGVPHFVESGYAYGEVFAEPRLIRIESGKRTIVAKGANPPWNGVAFHDGAFFVSEGGVNDGGKILRITPDGAISTVVDKLPSLGDHHTNGPAVSPDGWLYFGQGTATNGGVVGPDNAEFGWLARHPQFHDLPCQDITLAGVNHESKDVRANPIGDKVQTGAYSPFGTPSQPGQVVRGQVPCNGAVMRVRPEGGPIELVAWGLRNPFGLAFAGDGTLYVTDNGADVRGSRPILGAADVLWRIEHGRWYGWPDHSEGRPVTLPRYQAPGEPQPKQLISPAPGEVPEPVAYLAVHSSSNGLDVSRSDRFGFVGEAFIAQLGDMTPGTGRVYAPVGFRVVRVDTRSGAVIDFAVNNTRGRGPASKLRTGGLERPVAVRFDPSGESLYVVDFGVILTSRDGPQPQLGTGTLWRIRRAP